MDIIVSKILYFIPLILVSCDSGLVETNKIVTLFNFTKALAMDFQAVFFGASLVLCA